jgi:hypothetical protein
MNKEYDNTDRGVLFKNDRKEQDNHPDYKGSINVGGTDFWLSAWIKEGQKGKFMSLSIKPKEDAPAKPQPKRQAVVLEDDQIPFADPYKGKKGYAI